MSVLVRVRQCDGVRGCDYLSHGELGRIALALHLLSSNGTVARATSFPTTLLELQEMKQVEPF